jgi:XTP/dITP diphosphohydrolase
VTGRVVLLVTTPRVAPGLLTWQAWRELRQAAQVLAGSADHPLLPVLTEAGIGWQVLPEGPAADLPARLAGAAAAASGNVIWLCDPDSGGPGAAGLGAAGPAAAGPGEQAAAAEALAAAVAGLPASAGGGVPAAVLTGSRDLPGGQLLRLVAVMDRLRVECPWDARQTHESLAPHLLEEPYEALEALENDDQAALREELGDVLLQVMFHARVAAERDDGTGYTIDDVAEGIVTKLVRRHPHVFGDVTVGGADEVKRNWDQIKAAERAGSGNGPASALDGVPFGQPALALATQLQRRAERAGVPAGLTDLPAADAGPDAGAAGGAESGAGPGAGEGAGAGQGAGAVLGEQLFALVGAARAAGLDPELELRAAARRYRDRVRAWERASHP